MALLKVLTIIVCGIKTYLAKIYTVFCVSWFFFVYIIKKRPILFQHLKQFNYPKKRKVCFFFTFIAATKCRTLT